MAPAAIVKFSQFQIFGSAISRSITSIAGSAVTNRGSGGSSGIFVHQNHWAAKKATAQAPDWMLCLLGDTNSCNQQRFSRQEGSGRGLEEQFEMVACPGFEPTAVYS